MRLLREAAAPTPHSKQMLPNSARQSSHNPHAHTRDSNHPSHPDFPQGAKSEELLLKVKPTVFSPRQKHHKRKRSKTCKAAGTQGAAPFFVTWPWKGVNAPFEVWRHHCRTTQPCSPSPAARGESAEPAIHWAQAPQSALQDEVSVVSMLGSHTKLQWPRLSCRFRSAETQETF